MTARNISQSVIQYLLLWSTHIHPVTVSWPSVINGEKILKQTNNL